MPIIIIILCRAYAYLCLQIYAKVCVTACAYYMAHYVCGINENNIVCICGL